MVADDCGLFHAEGAEACSESRTDFGRRGTADRRRTSDTAGSAWSIQPMCGRRGRPRRFNFVRPPLRRPVQPGAVRTIEYEIVPTSRAPVAVKAYLSSDSPGAREHVAVLRCVDCRGEKVTVLGSAEHFQMLLESGAASDPSGVMLPKEAFPVVMEGWSVASCVVPDGSHLGNDKCGMSGLEISTFHLYCFICTASGTFSGPKQPFAHPRLSPRRVLIRSKQRSELVTPQLNSQTEDGEPPPYSSPVESGRAAEGGRSPHPLQCRVGSRHIENARVELVSDPSQVGVVLVV